MCQEDGVLKQLERLAQNVAHLIEKDNPAMLIQVYDEKIGGKKVNLIQYLLELIEKRKINQAENVLFENLLKLRSSEVKTVVDWFYDSLALLSDSELGEAMFSREEIARGRREALSYF
ncbi:MAG: DUF6483 family protein [Lactobacillales bacterium]|jgi:hypothetical protein|nr:DUF6483 family protein [Lactobacillales bacterium]